MLADDVRIARLVMQRLAGLPASDAAAAIGDSLCVQAQDAPLYLDSLALRCGATETGAATAADAGEFLRSGAAVRTHILRPTWHAVAADDLRWVQALTGPRVLRSLRGRQRQLELDDDRLDRGQAVIADALRGDRHLVRREVAEELVAAGVLAPGPLLGSQVGHLLIAAELAALICSGAPRGLGAAGHTYALVEEWLAPTAARTREEATVEVVRRFFSSHGPVTLKDLQRWTRLPLGDVRAAIGELGDAAASVEVDGVELWYGAAAMAERGPGSAGWAEAARQAREVFLLSIFDEVLLSHTALPFPRLAGHHQGDAPYPFNESGGGLVLAGLRDVGYWKRSQTANSFSLRVHLAPGVSAAVRHEVRRAAAAFVARNCPAGTPSSVELG